jgi:hypothetical protein
MPIIVSDTTGDFEPAPEGLHQAVCCDVVELGLVENEWGRREMIELRWQLVLLREDGKPYLVSRRFTRSLHEKSALRPFLEGWRGKTLTPEELRGFDLERLIGVNCMVQILHRRTSSGRVYAAVQNAYPLLKGTPKLEVVGYTRVKDREELKEQEEDLSESAF